MLRFVVFSFNWADEIDFQEFAIVDDEYIAMLDYDIWPVEISVGSNQVVEVDRNDIGVYDIPDGVNPEVLLGFLKEHRVNGDHIWQVLDDMEWKLEEMHRKIKEHGHFLDNFEEVFPPSDLPVDRAKKLLSTIIGAKAELESIDPKDERAYQLRDDLRNAEWNWHKLLKYSSMSEMVGLNRERSDAIVTRAARVLGILQE